MELKQSAYSFERLLVAVEAVCHAGVVFLSTVRPRIYKPHFSNEHNCCRVSHGYTLSYVYDIANKNCFCMLALTVRNKRASIASQVDQLHQWYTHSTADI